MEPAPDMRIGRRASLIGLCSAILLPLCRAEAQEGSEPEVKADYLYKLASFVDWPASALGASSNPLVICIIGNDPFGPILDRAIAGRRVADRPITVQRLPQADRNLGCHIVYLSGTGDQPVTEALRVLKGTPVLTVTDASDTPGMIDFVLVQGHVRFRADEAAAAEAGLTISSKLLDLATSVKPRATKETSP